MQDSYANKLVVFRLGEQEFALPIDRVQSVESTKEIKFVPNLPPAVLGIVHLREDILPVIDLFTLLELAKPGGKQPDKLMVVIDRDNHYGFLVDEAKEVIVITEEMIHSTAITIEQFESVVTIIKMGSRLITLLDLGELLGTVSQHPSTSHVV